jgi:hypothetical protein
MQGNPKGKREGLKSPNPGPWGNQKWMPRVESGTANRAVKDVREGHPNWEKTKLPPKTFRLTERTESGAVEVKALGGVPS